MSEMPWDQNDPAMELEQAKDAEVETTGAPRLNPTVIALEADLEQTKARAIDAERERDEFRHTMLAERASAEEETERAIHATERADRAEKERDDFAKMMPDDTSVLVPVAELESLRDIKPLRANKNLLTAAARATWERDEQVLVTLGEESLHWNSLLDDAQDEQREEAAPIVKALIAEINRSMR